jgi:hypothetical protein
MKRLLFVCLVLSLAAGSASADYLVIMDERSVADPDEPPQEHRIYLGNGVLKFTDGDGGMMIYRAADEVMYAVETSSESYYVMDKESMTAMASQIGAMTEQMKAALEQLPEDQREMAAKYMAESMGSAGAAAAPTVKVEDTGKTERIDGKACKRYDVQVGGEKENEIWVTDFKNVGMNAGDFQVFRDFAGFMGDLMASVPQFGDATGDNAFSSMAEIDGFPVLIREFDGETVETENKLRSVEEVTVDEAEYMPPEGFTEKKMGPGAMEEE